MPGSQLYFLDHRPFISVPVPCYQKGTNVIALIATEIDAQ